MAEQHPTLPDDIKAMSFETALAELETLVRSLEQGQIGLDDSLAAYERGTALKRHCAEKLKAAELRVEQLSLSVDGTLTATAAELD